MICQECKGKRYIVRMEPETWGSSRNWCYTGREVERQYQCEACHGTGEVPDPEPPASAGTFEVEGQVVFAPGFTDDQFLAFVHRGLAASLQTFPSATPGAVMVPSGHAEDRYTVTRTSCTCPGHEHYGRCYHRALAIFLADIQHVNICAIPTRGGTPAPLVTIGVQAVTGKAVAA